LTQNKQIKAQQEAKFHAPPHPSIKRIKFVFVNYTHMPQHFPIKCHHGKTSIGQGLVWQLDAGACVPWCVFLHFTSVGCVRVEKAENRARSIVAAAGGQAERGRQPGSARTASTGKGQFCLAERAKSHADTHSDSNVLPGDHVM
jgi:hypothetical protein